MASIHVSEEDYRLEQLSSAESRSGRELHPISGHGARPEALLQVVRSGKGDAEPWRADKPVLAVISDTLHGNNVLEVNLLHFEDQRSY